MLNELCEFSLVEFMAHSQKFKNHLFTQSFCSFHVYQVSEFFKAGISSNATERSKLSNKKVAFGDQNALVLIG